ncbi:hypothetical protein [Brevundimonas sp.]
MIIVNTRAFIKAEAFFGPDRRRVRDGSYSGAPRRARDQSGDKDVSAA